MIGKFKKKPVVVEAVQFTDETKDQVFNFVRCNKIASYDSHGNPILVIQTLEGDMVTNFGDWVIKGIAGEFYPCKNDIFIKSYQPLIEENSSDV